MRRKNLLGSKCEAFRKFSNDTYWDIRKALKESGSAVDADIIYVWVRNRQSILDSMQDGDARSRLARLALSEMENLYPESNKVFLFR